MLVVARLTGREAGRTWYTKPTKPAHISRVRVERLAEPRRVAHLPAADEPVRFGVHSQVAEHYGVDPETAPAEAPTLDYAVAAAAG